MNASSVVCDNGHRTGNGPRWLRACSDLPGLRPVADSLVVPPSGGPLLRNAGFARNPELFVTPWHEFYHSPDFILLPLRFDAAGDLLRKWIQLSP